MSSCTRKPASAGQTTAAPGGLRSASAKTSRLSMNWRQAFRSGCRGASTRVDVAAGAGAAEQFIIIIDYKSGKHNNGKKPYRFTDLSESNPDACGRKLQMPLYLKAAEQLVRSSNGAGAGTPTSPAQTSPAQTSPAQTSPNQTSSAPPCGRVLVCQQVRQIPPAAP